MKVRKNIPESQSALIRLVKNCKYADEWQITESFLLRNKNYNLTVHPYNLNTKDQTKVRFVTLNHLFVMLSFNFRKGFLIFSGNKMLPLMLNFNALSKGFSP